ncbi:MAG: four helix bundle suffix domain-containing protein, partial [bacterium]
ELRLDYEDFLRQRGLPQWAPDRPALKRFKARRCSTLDDVRAWVAEEHRRAQPDTDSEDAPNDASSVPVGERPCRTIPSSVFVANAALSLLNLCCYFLDRQIAAQAKAFEQEGGFTERLYKTRQQARKRR